MGLCLAFEVITFVAQLDQTVDLPKASPGDRRFVFSMRCGRGWGCAHRPDIDSLRVEAVYNHEDGCRECVYMSSIELVMCLTVKKLLLCSDNAFCFV